MKLLNDFYRIVEQDGRKCKVEMNGDHKIYKAHFPGNPITPGVCLVQMAVEMCELIWREHYKLEEIEKIRYRHVVKPSDCSTFLFTPYGGENGREKVVVKIEDNEKRFTEMTLYLRKER